MNEAQLLARVRAGDEQAFGELFALHQRLIYRYAVHMCGAETADDIVQDTFMALLTHNRTFDATRGIESLRMSFIVNRPAVEPGFGLQREEGPGRQVRYTLRSYATQRPEGQRYAEERRKGGG